MEALKRRPNLTVRKSMTLEDGTKIEVIGITTRKYMEIFNKKLSDMERAMYITAARILVDGKPVVYDDLMDCFTSEEIETIVEFANTKEEGEKND